MKCGSSQDGDNISNENVCVTCVLLFPICIHTVRYIHEYLDRMMKMIVGSVIACFRLSQRVICRHWIFPIDLISQVLLK